MPRDVFGDGPQHEPLQSGTPMRRHDDDVATKALGRLHDHRARQALHDARGGTSHAFGFEDVSQCVHMFRGGHQFLVCVGGQRRCGLRPDRVQHREAGHRRSLLACGHDAQERDLSIGRRHKRADVRKRGCGER